MIRRNFSSLWLPVLLLAALLLGGCAREERLRKGNPNPVNQDQPATQIEAQSDALSYDAQELDLLLEDLEKELRNMDTNIDIP